MSQEKILAKRYDSARREMVSCKLVSPEAVVGSRLSPQTELFWMRVHNFLVGSKWNRHKKGREAMGTTQVW